MRFAQLLSKPDFACGWRSKAGAQLKGFYRGFYNFRVRVPQNERAPRSHQIKKPVPILVFHPSAFAFGNKQGVTINRRKGSDGRIDSTRDSATCGLKKG
jgi:hypothetical protein